jgi:hypothetical protein
MSAINVIQTVSAVHFFSDAAIYDANGVVQEIRSKLFAVPAARSALGAIGPSEIINQIGAIIGGAASIESLIEEARLVLPLMVADASVGSDGTTWVDLNSFTWNTSTQTQAVTGMPSTGARYLRMIKVGTSGTITNAWYEEFEFKTATGASLSYNNMTLVTTAQTAAAALLLKRSTKHVRQARRLRHASKR